MSDPFIFVNTYGIREGMTDEYREGCGAITDMVRSEQPRIHYFGFFVNDEGTEATTIQIHPDADSMLRHMELAEKHIEQSVEFLDFTKMEISLYGTPNEAVLEKMRQLSGTGVPVKIKTPTSSVTRLLTVSA